MRRLLSLFFVCLSLSAAIAQPMPDTLWTRYYDAEGAETTQGFAATTDGGYVIVGRTWGPTPTYTYFLRISSNGSVTAQQVINAGGTQGNGAVDVYPLPNGSGFMVAGYVNNGSAGNDGYLMKTFLIGTPQWTHTFGDANRDEVILSMAPADDGGFLIGGYSSPHGTPNYAGYLAKLNSSGVFQWSRTYGNIGLGAIGRLRPLGDDTYIIAGAADTSVSAGSWDFFSALINGSGDTLWTSIFGGPGREEADDVIRTSDGGFLFVGSTYSGAGTGQIYMVRTDADGDSLWTRAFADTVDQYATSVTHGPGDGFVLVGAAVAGEWDENLYLIGIDPNGNERWSRTWRHALNGYANEVLATSDGGYCIMANAIPGNSNDVYVVKTGPDLGYGADEPGPELPRTIALNAYPNPFNSQARITFTLPRAGTAGLDLYNIAGQKIRNLLNAEYGPGEHSIVLNADGLATGTYLIKLNATRATQTQKVVLVK